jgi:outer membrane biosynthesis protein TonB
MNNPNSPLHSRKKDNSSLYFFVSIILHLILLLLFLRFAFKEQNPFGIQEPQQYDTDVSFEMPAELKPQQGTLDETPDTAYQPSSVSLQPPQPVQQPDEAEKTKPVEEKQTPKQEPERKDAVPRLSKVELKQFALNNLLKKKPPVKETIEEEKQQPLIPQSSINNTPQNLSFSIPMGTAVDQNIGHDLAERLGDPNKRPSAEELKYISYIRRIAKIISDNLRFLVNHQFNNQIEVTFEFDKKGYILRSSSQSTTHQNHLANQVITTIKELSPFPPIPNHWKCDSVLPTVTLYWRTNYNQPVLYSCYSFAAYGNQ